MQLLKTDSTSGDWAKPRALILIGALMVLVQGCTGGYNIPFINTDETLQLRFGMTPSEVKGVLGTPYYVHSGGEGALRWVYEVRTEVVKSDTPGTLAKTGQDRLHAPPVHRLAVDFQDGKLIKWSPLEPEMEVSQ
jgi:outer membrane protein assembly factor BamE (lipoprotein component of BamABCDE complex)